MTFKHEWDERMNGEPNWFYDLPDELQEMIKEKACRSSFQTCLKEMLWRHNMLKVGVKPSYRLETPGWRCWRNLKEPHRNVYPRDGFIHLTPAWKNMDGSWWQTHNHEWDGPNKTKTTSNDMKTYLENNGFTGLKSKNKTQLIRLCLSF